MPSSQLFSTPFAWILTSLTLAIQDCQPFFDINPTVDLQLQGDDDDICAGFFYARSTDANIRLLDKVLTYVNTCMDDQTALRRFLHEEEGFAHRLTVKPDDLAMTHAIDWTRGPQTFELKEGVSNYAVLPRAAFPNGTAYFNVKLPQRFGLVPYVVHNNCIIGHDSKVDRFRMYNMWFIAEPVDVTFEKASNELNSHSPVLSLTPHREVVTHLSISPDGKTLYTSAYDKTVKTYRIETIKEAIDKGEVQLKPSGGGLLNRRGGVWCMAWAPSHAEAPQAAALSTLASALGSAGVSSSALAMLSHPTTDAKEPSTEPICITGGHDRHLMVWSTHDGLASDTFANQGPWVLQHTMKGHQGIVNDLCFHRDLVFSASDDCTVRSWDIKKGEKTRIYRAGNGWMSSLAADGPALFAASSDGCAYAWEIASARLMQVYVGHIGWVRTIAVHGASKRVYTAGADGNIKEWDMVSGDCKRTLRSAHSAGINKIALHHSETGKLLLDSASDDGLVRTWDVETLACIEDFEGCTGSVNTIVRQGNLLIAGCADHTVKVWKSNL